MQQFAVGQRWISTMEPELGIGKITHYDERFVVIKFEISNVERRYAFVKAPLKRVIFAAKDKILNNNNQEIIIKKITEKDNLYYYSDEKLTICEKEISDTVGFNTPDKKLIKGNVDDLTSYNLRYEALNMNNRIKKSTVYGFSGGRIDLIPHQVYIANEVAGRNAPRILLSDEVGLGKTIEACLILHRLIITGRIKRVLIIVPHSLVNQWYIELLRRFNLIFTIYNEKYCKQIEKNAIDSNPFLETQQVLTDLDFITMNEKRKNQILAADWDMIVVDEAHHIKVGTEIFKIIKKLSDKTDGMILLTATPEQLGERSHFHRLQLLDGKRFFNFDEFLKEHDNYIMLANIADKIINKKELEKKHKSFIKDFFDKDTKLLNLILDEKYIKNKNIREKLIHDLLDRYGIGRIVFRNTRSVVKGFGKRKLVALDFDGSGIDLNKYESEKNFEYNINNNKYFYELYDDVRIKWLADFLQKNTNEKMLIICNNKYKVKGIKNALLKINPGFRVTMFHEDLDLMERDKNAYYFQDDNGARVLICSEIGSEGRNFQFVNNLMLFDIPLNPDLLEQRIGRLDRIGQTKTVKIYVPFIKNTHLEVLAKWYHEGLNAFEKILNTGSQIYEKYKQIIDKLCSSIYIDYDKSMKQLFNIIEETEEYNKELLIILESGRDRLLEMHSFDEKKASIITGNIDEIDNDISLEEFMNKAFDHYGIRIKPLDKRTYFLTPGNMKTDAFAKIKSGGLRVTYNRKKALLREDFPFITPDHPLVNRVFDLILGNEDGSTSFGVYQGHNDEEVLLETVYVLECVCPKKLYIERYLPPTPLRVVVNHKLEDSTKKYSYELFCNSLKKGNHDIFLKKHEVTHDLIPAILEKCNIIIKKKSDSIINKVINSMKKDIFLELERLSELKKVNKNIKKEEIISLQKEMDDLEEYLKKSRTRLDAVRLIWKTK